MATCRLDVHVTKGRADGLHVSSVGAAGELWAVIMDAGTQFTAQARPPSRPGARAAAAGAAGVRLGGLRQAGELRARAAPCVAAPGGAEGSGGCAAARRVPLHCQAAVQPESARGALSARPRARRRCTAWRNASSCPRTGSWSSGTPGTTSPPSPVRRAPRSSPPPAGSPAGRLTCRASARALALRGPGLGMGTCKASHAQKRAEAPLARGRARAARRQQRGEQPGGDEQGRALLAAELQGVRGAAVRVDPQEVARGAVPAAARPLPARAHRRRACA